MTVSLEVNIQMRILHLRVCVFFLLWISSNVLYSDVPGITKVIILSLDGERTALTSALERCYRDVRCFHAQEQG